MNSNVIRWGPEEDDERIVEVYFTATVAPGDEEAVAARLRMQFPGVDVKFQPNGVIHINRGDYTGGAGWHAITATDMAEVVQSEGPLLHLVLAPDPMVIDAILMRTSRTLRPPELDQLKALGLTVSLPLEPQGYAGRLYRLAPWVGNPWPSRRQIAVALKASHTQPTDTRRW